MTRIADISGTRAARGARTLKFAFWAASRWIMAAVMALGLCTGASQAQTQAKVLRVVPSADLTVLDPMYTALIITRLYSLMVYETLFAWDARLQPKPQMVDTWSVSPDQLLWRFTLRTGLKFHDGRPVTTTDVIASLKRWMSRDVLGQKVGLYVAGMEAVDKQTFEMRLSRPAAFLPFALGSAAGQIPAIMRASDLTGDPAKPVTTAIGSGPFSFNREEWRAGSYVRFDRNPDYIPRAEPPDGLAGGRVVKVDRVEWKVIPDVGTAVSALQTGEVDILEQPPLELLPVLQKNAAIRIQKLNTLSYQGVLRANALYPPFNDPRARQALSYLADQSEYMTAAFGDESRWHRCAAYFICGGPFGSAAKAETDGRANIEKAKQLLADSGYRGEKLIFLATKELPSVGQMTEVAADALRRAGVNVDVQWYDWGTMAGRITKKDPPDAGGWNLFVTYATGIVMNNPMTNVGTNMNCEKRNWNGWPCDEEAERLRQEFVDAPDDASRQAAVARLQARLEEVTPYSLLGEFDAPIAIRGNVTGMLQSPVIAYWNVDKP